MKIYVENLCCYISLLLLWGRGVHTCNNSLFLIAARRAERNHREDEGDGTKQWSLFRHSNCEFWSWQGVSRVTAVNKQTWHRAPVGTLYLATMRENHSKGQMDFNLVITLRGSYVGLLSSSNKCVSSIDLSGCILCKWNSLLLKKCTNQLELI